MIKEDLDILNKYANNNYSIGGNVKSNDETNYKIIRNYKILKEKSVKELKKLIHMFFHYLINKYESTW
ncbi:hypothetical protein ALNOE001_04230 [Candidatus Methanobinarius endosymbioticus]|uniref:Uncharacterized protein n=1 Tax=Candidatus Methanobinarius endosymbioticus TaxID=2006182 RepID=A0A366MD56_9EURY|nr:hypothetical protein ALNOE001_04230 [Candidatus Methanobinarius endosymbioticus]